MSFFATFIASDIFQVGLLMSGSGSFIFTSKGLPMRISIERFFRSEILMKLSGFRKRLRRGIFATITFTGFVLAIIIVKLFTEGSKLFLGLF